MGRPIFLSHRKADEEIESSENIHILHSDRLIFLAGAVEEQPISSAIIGMIQMLKKDQVKPINLMISTFGGSILEMFALYDVIQYVKSKGCPVITAGIGKIMSAGVPLLACGTRGLRRIGKYATIMIHNAYDDCPSGGDVFHMKNEMAEMGRQQDMMNKLMLEHTKISKEELNKLLGNRLDVYFPAEKAIELGIADKFLEDE